MKTRLLFTLILALLLFSVVYAEQKVVGDEKIALNSARIYIKQGNWDKALAQYSIVLKRYPDNIESISNCADIYVKFATDTVKYKTNALQNYIEAYSLYSRALIELAKPENIETSKGKRDEQLKLEDRCKKYGDACLNSVINLGIVEYNAGNLDGALSIFTRLRDAAPSDFRPYRYISAIYEDKAAATTNAEESKALTQQAIASLEQAVKDPTNALDRRRLAGMYYNLGDYNKSLLYYKDAFTVDQAAGKQDIESLYNISLCYMGLNDSTKAYDTMKQVVQLDPTNVDALIQCSNYALRFGQDEQALQYNKSAADIINPSEAAGKLDVFTQLCFKYYKKITANKQEISKLQQQLSTLKPKDSGRASLESQIAQITETNKPIYREMMKYIEIVLTNNDESIDALSLGIEAAKALGETEKAATWQKTYDTLQN